MSQLHFILSYTVTKAMLFVFHFLSLMQCLIKIIKDVTYALLFSCQCNHAISIQNFCKMVSKPGKNALWRKARNRSSTEVKIFFSTSFFYHCIGQPQRFQTPNVKYDVINKMWLIDSVCHYYYWKLLAFWSTSTADKTGKRSPILPSFRYPFALGCMGNEREKTKQGNLWSQATGVRLRWGLQLNQTIHKS